MKTLIGTVVSTKMQKTVVVEITRLKKHPLYKKIMRKKNKIKAHCDDGNIKTGMAVKIGETKPISKDKHFKVLQIVK